MPVTPNALLDLAAGVGQVRSMVRFEILDWDLNHAGWVTPLAAQSISAGIGGANARQLQGFKLGPREIRDVDPFRDRIRPWWILEDGTRWPLGVFVFTDLALTRGTYADVQAAALLDLGHVLSQGTTAPLGLSVNGGIGKAVHRILDLCNITHRDIPAAPSETVGDPPNWPAGTTKYQILTELCQLAGWLPPFFDAMGVFTIRSPVDINVDFPDHVYKPHRVKHGSVVETSAGMDSPNVYVVTCTGPTKAEITATARVHPDLPYSVENRHFEVVSVHQAQSIDSTARAQRMANALAAGSVKGYQAIDFVGPPDPRHDLYQTVDWQGVVYRETGWNLSLTAGGDHSHSLTRGGFPGA